MQESARWLYAKGKEAFENQEYEDALQHLLAFAERVDSFADVWNLLGQIYHHQGDPKKAIAAFEKALALNPRYAEAQFNLAISYSEIGEYEKAEGLYQTVRETEPGPGDQRIRDPFVRGKLANMHADLGDVYHGLGVFEDAVREYMQALSLRPEFPDVRARLAQALFDAGKKTEALTELAEVKNSKPDYLPVRIQLGVFHYSLGHHRDAITEWREVLEIDPQHEKAKMYLRLAAKTKK